jgi:hypothetical protein
MTSWRDVIKPHPAAELLPLMSSDEKTALSEDIKANGIQVPMAFYVDEKAGLMVLDGRNRLDAMEAIGYRFVLDDHGHLKVFDPSGKSIYVDWPRYRYCDPYEYVISANIHRRHLTATQKADVIEALLRAKPERSDRATAKIAKVDHKTVAAKREKLQAGGEIPHQEKRVGSDGKAQPTTKAKGQVPLDDPSRPRNRPGPVSEARARAAREVDAIIGKSLPRGADKEAEVVPITVDKSSQPLIPPYVPPPQGTDEPRVQQNLTLAERSLDRLDREELIVVIERVIAKRNPEEQYAIRTALAPDPSEKTLH